MPAKIYKNMTNIHVNTFKLSSYKQGIFNTKILESDFPMYVQYTRHYIQVCASLVHVVYGSRMCLGLVKCFVAFVFCILMYFVFVF